MINLKKRFLLPFIFSEIFSSLINTSLLGESIKIIEKPNSTINWEKIISEDVKQQTKEIEWEEALKIATQWLSEVRNKDPKKLAFFTGRAQSQSLTGWGTN